MKDNGRPVGYIMILSIFLWFTGLLAGLAFAALLAGCTADEVEPSYSDERGTIIEAWVDTASGRAMRQSLDTMAWASGNEAFGVMGSSVELAMIDGRLKVALTVDGADHEVSIIVDESEIGSVYYEGQTIDLYCTWHGAELDHCIIPGAIIE